MILSSKPTRVSIFVTFEDVEGRMSEEQYDSELDEHTQLIDELRESLEDLQDCQAGTAALGRLDISHKVLEACISKGYDAGMKFSLTRSANVELCLFGWFCKGMCISQECLQ